MGTGAPISQKLKEKEGFLEKMTLFVSEKQIGSCLRQVWDTFSLLISIMWLVNSSFGKTDFHVQSSLIEIAACLLFEKNPNQPPNKKNPQGFNHSIFYPCKILGSGCKALVQSSSREKG